MQMVGRFEIPGEGMECIVPAGRYWIGDPCYVSSSDKRWDAFLAEAIKIDGMSAGMYAGRECVKFYTAHGDGFFDSDEFSFPVDSGCIGLVSAPEGTPPAGMEEIVFDESATCSSDGRKICLGHVVIDTNPSIEDDEEEDREEAATPSP